MKTFTLVFLIATFFVNTAEAKSLKAGEVYRALDGSTLEVISEKELEFAEKDSVFVCEHGFKGDKLRTVCNILGTKSVTYYLLIEHGLKDEKSGKTFYVKSAFDTIQAGAAKIKAEQEKQEKLRKKLTDNGNGTVTQGTGLMWQKEDDGKVRDWDDAIAYCNELRLGGHSDWRLPSKEEIVEVLVAGKRGILFSGEFYWLSTTHEQFTTNAYTTNFESFLFIFNDKTSDDFRVRCVRPGQGAANTAPSATKVAPTKPGAEKPAKYKDNGNGTISAKNTGLMWQKQDDGEERNWDDAVAYCKELGLAGYSDWRIPSKEELKSLIEGRSWEFDWEGESKAGYSEDEIQDHWDKNWKIEKARFLKEDRPIPVIDTEYFPDTRSSYWSSTAHVDNTACAWEVNLGVGYVTNSFKTAGNPARCVRPGR